VLVPNTSRKTKSDFEALGIAISRNGHLLKFCIYQKKKKERKKKETQKFTFTTPSFLFCADD
jgi:hypothetical protein